MPSEPHTRSHHRLAPPVVWTGLITLLVAFVAVSFSLHAASQARRTTETSEAARRWLELFRIERDLVYACERMETTALFLLITGEGSEAEAGARAAFTRQLEQTEGRLEAFVASGSRGNGAGLRLLRMVETHRGTYEPPDSAIDSLHSVSLLYTSPDWIPLTPPDGEWFELSTFVYGLQVATYYPLQTLDEYLARYWEIARPPTEPEVEAHIKSLIAWLHAVDLRPRATETARWEVDPLLDADRARGFDPRLGELVARLLARPEARVIRDTAPFLLQGTVEPHLPPDEMLDQMTRYGDLLMARAEDALALTDAVIAVEARRERQRARLAGTIAVVSTAVAIVVLIAIEIHRRGFNRHLLRLAETDALTGLGNRLALNSTEPARLADPAQGGFALIQLDLDNFKAINDSFGHPVGDQALVAFASRCRGVVRADDTLARIGGDEFVVVLHHLRSPEQSARDIARRIQTSLAEPIDCGGRSLRLQVSMGIATAAGPADLDELLVEADLALYAAKECGRDRHEVFADATRRLLVRELPRVLAERGLAAAFQPQVDLDTGEVVGVEALARWPHATASEVPAGKVIQVIEWLGQTPALLRCMLTRVEEAHERTRGLFGGRFWLNLSPLDLATTDAAGKLLDVLAGSSVPFERLGLEITESLPITDFGRTAEVLVRLREAGLAVAIDDFGSHNTPLRHLTRLPVDIVKLDRCVVSGIDADDSNLVLARAVSAIGDAHGTIVLAEGVETDAEMAVLRGLGIRHAQGYAIARPMPLEELAAFLDRAPAFAPARPEVRFGAGPSAVRATRAEVVPLAGHVFRASGAVTLRTA